MASLAEVRYLQAEARALAIHLDDISVHTCSHGTEGDYYNQFEQRQSLLKKQLRDALQNMHNNNIDPFTFGHVNEYYLARKGKKIAFKKRGEYTRSCYMMKCKACGIAFPLPADVFSNQEAQRRIYCSHRCASGGDIHNATACEYCMIGAEHDIETE